MGDWEPARYLRYADERSRPFTDLVGRIEAGAPRLVADLGCGPGQLTAALAERWPSAEIWGVDSSPAMIDQARRQHAGAVRFVLADLRSWQPPAPVDVLISNATLQWVPDHRALLPRLIAMVAESGWFAFQVPGNFDQPSHVLLRHLAEGERFTAATADLVWPASASAAEYLADLADLGCRVEAWETTYLHVLSGENPVFDWIAGTGARPVLQALSEEQRALFVPEYQALLREAYPPRPYGTVLPFRRVFVVAQRLRTLRPDA